MKQYNAIKAKYPDALLLFRVGDFYETFGSDAIRASKILGIVLTKRKNGAAAFIELAGFPHHSLDTYLPKLVRAGNRVAICDQLEDPKLTKTIVKRGVTELVTPGVTYNDNVLDTGTNNYLAAVHFGKKESGVSFLDISTGEFLVAQGSLSYIDKLIQGFKPNEVLYQRNHDDQFTDSFGNKFYTFRMEDWAFSYDFAYEKLLKHFSISSLKGFGIENMNEAISAAGAALQYLDETKHNEVGHIRNISRIAEDKYVWLDRFTIRNLELLYSYNEDAITLAQIMDHTVSPMGSRLLKRWMVLPLKTKSEIEERLSVVEYLVDKIDDAEEISIKIKQIGDLERLIGKAAVGRINPKEVVQVKRALENIEPIKSFCLSSKNKELQLLGDKFNLCEKIKERISTEMVEDPPMLMHKGMVIADGVDEELDSYRKLAFSGKDYLLEIQQREIKNTGISSLKIAFNNVFGYYLEVRNTYKDKVPEEWIRKQTLTQAERYITEELKEYESKILSAESKIAEIETRIYGELVSDLAGYVPPIQLNAQLIARLDCLMSFSKLSLKNNYVRPQINKGKALHIKEGRHPVIEQTLPIGEEYVSNDITLDTEQQQIIMITGPNMSGKSAILRQTALIVLMAQMGCFVPAKSADIGLVDKIFTRVGASDNISSGESTFMVEMNETASILNNLSDRSLILLDEIGRGTSTYDGVSIAWAISEYIHNNGKSRAKTLFATHYHELNEMTNSFKRIKNFNVSVRELKNKIIFLRKLVPGGSNHSFGIQVAKMAGMPTKVIQRANEVLKHLEKSHSSNLTEQVKEMANDMQLSFFQLDDPTLMQIKDEITKIDINTLTPVEALMKLNEIKKMVGG